MDEDVYVYKLLHVAYTLDVLDVRPISTCFCFYTLLYLKTQIHSLGFLSKPYPLKLVNAALYQYLCLDDHQLIGPSAVINLF